MNKEIIRKSFNETISRVEHLIIKHLLDPEKYGNKSHNYNNSYVHFDYETKPNKRINYLKLILDFIKCCLLSEDFENVSPKELYEEEYGWIDLNHLSWKLGVPIKLFDENVVFIDEQFYFGFFKVESNSYDDVKIVDLPQNIVEKEVKEKCSKISFL